MTEKAFHDEILRQGSMPISLLRLALGKEKLTRDMNIDWQFYGDLPTGPVVKQRFPFGTLIMCSNLKENVLVRLPGCAR